MKRAIPPYFLEEPVGQGHNVFFTHNLFNTQFT